MKDWPYILGILVCSFAAGFCFTTGIGTLAKGICNHTHTVAPVSSVK